MRTTFLSGMESRLLHLKQAEERDLAEIRRKRLVEEENLRKAAEQIKEEEHVNKLKEEEKTLEKLLKEKKKRVFQLEIEASSWERVTHSKSNELRTLEETLDRSLQNIWKIREEFCTNIDDFHQISHPLTNTRKNSLSSQIAEEEQTERQLNAKLDELEAETLKLISEPDSKEYNRLREWTSITRNRCSELRSRIAEAEKKTSSPVSNTNLFSIVSLEDVRRFSRKQK